MNMKDLAKDFCTKIDLKRTNVRVDENQVIRTAVQCVKLYCQIFCLGNSCAGQRCYKNATYQNKMN